MAVTDTSTVKPPAIRSFRQALVDFLSTFTVSILSLLLLVYVGFAEAERSYPGILDERLHGLAEVLRAGVAADLKTGAAVWNHDYLASRVRPVLQAEPAITALTLLDPQGQPLAAAHPGGNPGGNRDGTAMPPEPERSLQAELEISQASGNGRLIVAMKDGDHVTALYKPFERPVILAIMLSAAASILVAILRVRLGDKARRWALGVDVLLFVAVAALVASVLVSLRLDSLEAKAHALAGMVEQRLTEVMTTRLDAPDHGPDEGVTRVLADFRGLGLDVALIRDGRVIAHADPGEVGRPWVKAPWRYGHVADLATAQAPIRLGVTLPLGTLLERPDLQRALKNFAALLFASAFLAHLFRQVVGTLRGRWAMLLGVATAHGEIGESTLEKIKPIFFLAVLIENMGYAFLPGLLKDIAAGAGLSPGFASALFMAYFFGFALILVPSGQMASRFGPKPLITIGAALVAVGMFVMVASLNVALVGLARFIVGVGQGMILIGVQSYILEVASVGHRTRGAAIIVYGFNTGMITGIALGSLLVGHIGAQGIFLLSGVIATGILLFTQFLLPALTRHMTVAGGLGYAVRELGRNTVRALTSIGFIKATFLVGIPNKTTMTGIILFALPLLLSQQGVDAEDIGQIIMFYAAGMLITSPIVSRVVDRVGQSSRVLLIGSLISGIGLLLIGMTDWPFLTDDPNRDTLVTVILITAVLIIGMAHGFINAPVVTHVSELAIAREIGAARVTATYRFLERLGHVAGPIVIGQVLALGGNSAAALTWVGAAIIIFALLFAIGRSSRVPARSVRSNAAQRGTWRVGDPHR